MRPLLALLLLLPAPALARVDVETLVRNFRAIAFSSEYATKAPDVLKKWQGPIRVKIEGYRAGDYRPIVERHLADLRALTGLTIDMASWWQEPNFTIRFVEGRAAMVGVYESYGVSRKDASRLAGNNDCTFGTSRDDHLWTVAAQVLVDGTIRAGRIHDCIVEDVTQALGLPNDLPRNTPVASVFDDSNVVSDLTEHDRLLLRALYDPRLKVGMSWAEAEPVARRVFEELLR